jgi:nuclease-like protein
VNLHQALSSLLSLAVLCLFVLLPVFLMVAVVAICLGARRRYVPPVTDRLLRSPGESLRKRIEILDEKFMETLLWTLLYGPLCFVLFAHIWQDRMARVFYVELGIFVVFALSGFIFLAVRTVRALRERSDYMLGFSGERAVGEELSKLMLDGCQVFHDFPGGSNWNIDHIVVAPSGIYVIETKTRKKKKAPRGSRVYEIICDGERLDPPHNASLEQAKRNAKSLSGFLSDTTGEKIWVTPILTFPGWFVVQRGKPNPYWAVLNHKQIRGYVIGRPAKLTPQRIQQVTHQLDQKCRDVEF